MKINRIKEIPENYDHYTSQELDEYDLGVIPNNVREVWYWYGNGGYEGIGYLLMQTEDGLWYLHDCSHCSCYGPTSDINLSNGKNSLEELLNNCTDDVKKDIELLVKAVRT